MVPKNEKDVKHFIQLAEYYRRFIEHIDTKAAPLTRLLRKAVPWEWCVVQQTAFETLKAELSSKPLLVHPDFERDFVPTTHDSVVGLGAVLMQHQMKDCGPQSVAYASATNTEAESKYAITELERLAVVWSVKLFHPYLFRRKFHIITNHSALRWLMNAKDMKGRLHRWALTLQEYDFEVLYRPGRENVVADALSRAPLLRVHGLLQITDAQIHEEQSSSVMCERIGLASTYKGQRILVTDGLLRIATAQGMRVVLPTSLWAVAFKEAHDSIWSGHLKAPQTLARLRTKYWWQGMSKSVVA